MPDEVRGRGELVELADDEVDVRVEIERRPDWPRRRAIADQVRREDGPIQRELLAQPAPLPRREAAAVDEERGIQATPSVLTASSISSAVGRKWIPVSCSSSKPMSTSSAV